MGKSKKKSKGTKNEGEKTVQSPVKIFSRDSSPEKEGTPKEETEKIENFESSHWEFKKRNSREITNSNFSSFRSSSSGHREDARMSEPIRRGRHEGDERGGWKRYSSNDTYGRRPNFQKHEGWEFGQYNKEFRSHYGKTDYIKTKEIVADLFQMGDDYSLAHCVAEDMNMGSGIAVQFRRDFKRVDVLLNQNQRTGGLAVLNHDGKYIYYLVTKRLSSDKPTYRTLFSSLQKLKKHMAENNVRKLAIPRIGCGLDRLEWSNVKFMVEFLFREMDVEITVCNLEPTEESSPQQKHRNCKVIHETYALKDIESQTVVLYFSSEDGCISEEMQSLDEKFQILREFSGRRTLGNVIFNNKTRDYLLCGCIVRRNRTDDFDFEAFQKCLQKIQSENKKYKYYYYAFQAFKDEDSALINNKIINIMRNYLRDAEIYVCWVGDLQSEMPKQLNTSYNSSFGNKSDFETPPRKTDEMPKKLNTSFGNESDWETPPEKTDEWRAEQEANVAYYERRNSSELNEKWNNLSFGSPCPNITSQSHDSFERNSCDLNEKWNNLSFGSPCPNVTSQSHDSFERNSCDLNEKWNNLSFGSPCPNIPSQSHDWFEDGKQESEPPQKQEQNIQQDISEFHESCKNLPPKNVQEVHPVGQNEYELFQKALASNSINSSVLKEQNVPKLPRQYSRVCFAREGLIMESSVPPGPSIHPYLGELLNQNPKEGGFISRPDGNNFFYCLIISRPNSEPTLQNIFSSMQKLKTQVVKHSVRTLVVPKMDEKWLQIKFMFQYLFSEIKIDIIMAPFPSAYDVPSLKKKNSIELKHLKTPLQQMKKKSIILYLASTDGNFSKEMEGLKVKYDFGDDFKKRKKKLGDLIPYKQNEDNILYGCVVKKSLSASIDFCAFQKCLKEINETDKLPTVGIQAVDSTDESINYKIATLLLNTLKNVTINICWPGPLKAKMPSNV